jgi:hypothetical protein
MLESRSTPADAGGTRRQRKFRVLFPANFLRRVAAGQVRPAEAFKEFTAVVPDEARWNRHHHWWSSEGNALFDMVLQVGAKKVHLSARDAVREAIRSRGSVVVERLSGIAFYWVLPREQAEEAVAVQVVAEAVPEYELDRRWEQGLPRLERFQELVERRYLHRLLDKHNWNVTAAAKEADVARQTLHKLLARHRIKRPKLVLDQVKTDTAARSPRRHCSSGSWR